MTKVQSATQSLRNVRTEKIFWYLTSAVVVLLVLYVCLINVSIFNVVARATAINNANQMQSDLLELEYDYLSLSNQVTLPGALARGFEAASNPTFARLDETLPTLTYSGNETR